jgi:hypothetical protein
VIEVFKTNVQEKNEARVIISELCILFPNAKINFDLDDCDKILRIEILGLCVEQVIEVLRNRGFKCEVLN